jgi:hypothetical protein
VKANLVQRRQTILTEKALGHNLCEIVSHLADTFNVSKRQLYRDWQHRNRWLDAIVGIGDPVAFFLELVAAHQEVKRLAVKEYLTGDNSAARIGALRLIRDLTLDLNKMLVTRDLLARVERLENQAH